MLLKASQWVAITSSPTYEHHRIQRPSNFGINQNKIQGKETDAYVQARANRLAAQGLESHCIDVIGSMTTPGSLTSRSGARNNYQ